MNNVSFETPLNLHGVSMSYHHFLVNYPPLIKHGNGKWTIDIGDFPSYKPGFSSGIFHCHVWWHQRVYPLQGSLRWVMIITNILDSTSIKPEGFTWFFSNTRSTGCPSAKVGSAEDPPPPPPCVRGASQLLAELVKWSTSVYRYIYDISWINDLGDGLLSLKLKLHHDNIMIYYYVYIYIYIS